MTHLAHLLGAAAGAGPIVRALAGCERTKGEDVPDITEAKLVEMEALATSSNAHNKGDQGMTRIYTRLLTNWAAYSCEQAKKPICVCRCGGILHGKNHDAFATATNMLINQQGDISDEEIQDILKDLG